MPRIAAQAVAVMYAVIGVTQTDATPLPGCIMDFCQQVIGWNGMPGQLLGHG